MASSKAKNAGAGRGVRRPPADSSGPGRKPTIGTGEEAHLPWARRNYLILGAGGGAILIGFLLLVAGDTVIAPVLLVGGFLGLIPWGIVAQPSGGRKADRDETPKRMQG